MTQFCRLANDTNLHSKFVSFILSHYLLQKTHTNCHMHTVMYMYVQTTLVDFSLTNQDTR